MIVDGDTAALEVRETQRQHENIHTRTNQHVHCCITAVFVPSVVKEVGLLVPTSRQGRTRGFRGSYIGSSASRRRCYGPVDVASMSGALF